MDKNDGVGDKQRVVKEEKSSTSDSDRKVQKRNIGQNSYFKGYC